MNAFNFLDPLFVSPVAEIERGFFKAPKSYVLVVSKKSLKRATREMERRATNDIELDSDEDDDEEEEDEEEGNNNGRTNDATSASEIMFFDVHQDAATWLLDASYNAGYELLKKGSTNLDFRLTKSDLRRPPRGEGSTMASIYVVKESAPRIFSFESALRRDIFLRSTRSFGDGYGRGGGGSDDDEDEDDDEDDYGYYSGKKGRKKNGKKGGDDDDEEEEEEEEDPMLGAVIWDKSQYQVDEHFEEQVVPAKGVLAVALSGNNNNANVQTTNMTQSEEFTLAREMIRNPMLHRKNDLYFQQQKLNNNNSSNNNSQPSSPTTTTTTTTTTAGKVTITTDSPTAAASNKNNNNRNSVNPFLPCAPAQAPATIFNLPRFQAECANRLAETDIKIAALIVNEADRWVDMLQDIQQLDEDTILHLEARIENFSHELLSRRSIIEEIEKESLLRQQIKRNLDEVIRQVKGINKDLSFTRSAKAAIESLTRLQVGAPQDLEKEIKNNTSALEEAKDKVETVLATKKFIEQKYSKLSSIADRCVQFTLLRRDLARRIRSSLIYTVTNWNNNNNNNNKDTTSSQASNILKEPKVISLVPPSDFLRAIDFYSTFAETMRASDLAGYYAGARAIAKRVNEISVPQIGKFFLELRRRIAQMPRLANLRYSSGRQMNFDVDDFVSTTFVKRLYHSAELTPTALLPSAAQIRLRQKQSKLTGGGGDDDLDGTATTVVPGGGVAGYYNPADPAGSLGPNVVPMPEIKMDNTSRQVLLSESKSFRYFFPLNERETRTNESYQTGFINRLVRGGEDPWACRADIAVGCCATAVADLVITVRNYFVKNYKLLSVDPNKVVSGENWASALSANSNAFREENEGEEETEKSVWERADEVNTFLWLCFRRNDGVSTNLRSSSAMEFGSELIRLIEFVYTKCDLLFAIPIASILDSLIRKLDDGDAVSSKPVKERTIGGTGSDDRQQQAPSAERSGFLTHVLASCLTISLEKLNLYTAVQIEGMRRSARLFATKGDKVETLLPAYLVFPVALNRIETLLSQQLDPSYEAFEMFLNAIVPQMFSTLDAVTFRDDPAFTDGKFDVLPARDSDFIQFVHHSLFCVSVRNSVIRRTAEILKNRITFSESRRDQYEQRYILRSLFAKSFPQFASTAEVADGLIKRTINDTEAESSIRNSFDAQRVSRLCGTLIPEELPNGITSAKERARAHVARLVSSGDLVIRGFLVDVVKTSLAHLAMHLQGSLAIVERVRTIVTPNENKDFLKKCSEMLRELSR